MVFVLSDVFLSKPNSFCCGVEHYLIKTWDRILTVLEEESTACNLISIDFSKAFNSLDHGSCLEMFRRRGAGDHAIAMLYAFLQGRKMRVKIDRVFSNPLPINGGSPQGTLLGNLIFIVATSEIEKEIVYPNATGTANLVLRNLPATPEPTRRRRSSSGSESGHLTN